MKNDNLKYKKQKRLNGFSLLELIVYIAVLSIVTVISAGIFVSINRGGGQAEARSEVNSALRFAMEKISQDLRSATSTAGVLSPANTSAPSNVLTFTINGKVISYDVVNNQVRRIFDTVPEIVTPDSVKIDSLVFNRLENINSVFDKTFLSINMEIGASYNSESPDWQYSEVKKTTVGLR